MATGRSKSAGSAQAKEQEHVFNNRTLTEAKQALDFLAGERYYANTHVKVEIGRLHADIKRLFEPVNDAVLDMIEEHGEGEAGARQIKPGSVGERRFQRAHREFMKMGEHKLVFKPLKLEDLLVKRRDPQTGERFEDEVIDLSPDDINKLGPLLST